MRGLVLEGGGAKGAFHCGAAKAFYDNGYTFDGVAGTSIGAINGALIVQDRGYKKLYDLWENVTAEDISDFDNTEVMKLSNREFSKESALYWIKQAIKTLSTYGVPTDKAISYLRSVIDEDAVRESPMDFAVVTYCISERTPLELFKEEIPYGSLHEFIFASAYYPAFKMSRLNGKYYVDGGVYDNLPLNILTNKPGYDEIYAVRTMSHMPHKALRNADVNVHYICPSEDLGQTADLNRKRLNDKIKLGYYDTLRYIKGYNGYRYYIKGDTDLFSCVFRQLDAEMQENISELFDVSFSQFGEKLLSVNNKFSLCDDPYLRFFEYIAKAAGLEKYRLYSQRQFLEEILNKQEILQHKEKERKKIGQWEIAKQLTVFTEILPILREIMQNDGNE